MFKKLTLLILFLFSFNIQAEIYTWADEEGKKHFGDKIPLEYQERVEVLEVKVHKPTDEEINEIKETNRRINELLNESQQLRQEKKLRNRKELSKIPVKKKEEERKTSGY